LLTVTIRTFISPDKSVSGFCPGEPFVVDVPAPTTLEELTNAFFSKHIEQIGVMAVNGKLAAKETALSPGDVIDLYPLLEGG